MEINKKKTYFKRRKNLVLCYFILLFSWQTALKNIFFINTYKYEASMERQAMDLDRRFRTCTSYKNYKWKYTNVRNCEIHVHLH